MHDKIQGDGRMRWPVVCCLFPYRLAKRLKSASGFVCTTAQGEHDPVRAWTIGVKMNFREVACQGWLFLEVATQVALRSVPLWMPWPFLTGPRYQVAKLPDHAWKVAGGWRVNAWFWLQDG